MLLPFLPASQHFISLNLTHWILCLLGLWGFNNPRVQLAQSRIPPLLAGLILATSRNDCPASVYTTCTWIRYKVERATQLYPCCLQKTNSSTAMKSAKIIQCFPLDPRLCFLASLPWHIPPCAPSSPPRSYWDVCFAESKSLFGLQGSSTCVSREINQYCAHWTSVGPITGTPLSL